MAEEISTIKCLKRDKPLLNKIRGELGCKSVQELIHTWIQAYYGLDTPTVVFNGSIPEILDVK